MLTLHKCYDAGSQYSAMNNFIRIEIRKLISLVMKINRDILSGKTFLFSHSQSYLG